MTDNQSTEGTHGRGGYNKPEPLQHASSAQQDPQTHSQYQQVESAHQYVYQEPAAKYPGPREGNALASPYHQGTTPHNEFQNFGPPQNEAQYGTPSQQRMTQEPNSSVKHSTPSQNEFQQYDSPLRNDFQQYGTPLQNEFQNFGPPSQNEVRPTPDTNLWGKYSPYYH